MTAPPIALNAEAVATKSALIRAEILAAFDLTDPIFLLSGGENHGIAVTAPSLKGLPVYVADSLGIEFSRTVTQPLLLHNVLATLDISGHAFSGRVVVRPYQTV